LCVLGFGNWKLDMESDENCGRVCGTVWVEI
jgi:hypothetical protein